MHRAGRSAGGAHPLEAWRSYMGRPRHDAVMNHGLHTRIAASTRDKGTTAPCVSARRVIRYPGLARRLGVFIFSLAARAIVAGVQRRFAARSPVLLDCLGSANPRSAHRARGTMFFGRSSKFGACANSAVATSAGRLPRMILLMICLLFRLVIRSRRNFCLKLHWKLLQRALSLVCRTWALQESSVPLLRCQRKENTE